MSKYKACRVCGPCHPDLKWKTNKNNVQILWAYCPHCGKGIGPASEKQYLEKDLPKRPAPQMILPLDFDRERYA
jgi:hypothetical protein